MSEAVAREDMVNAAKEILAWQKTGVLEGDALRKIARGIRERFNNVFDMSQAIAQAEEQVKRDALKFLINGDATSLSEAERRARREALEEAAKTIEEGFDRGIVRKHDLCAHKKFEWEDCESCAANAVRALIPSEPHDAEGRETPRRGDPSIFDDEEGRN